MRFGNVGFYSEIAGVICFIACKHGLKGPGLFLSSLTVDDREGKQRLEN
jgi:hypothetical protein